MVSKVVLTPKDLKDILKKHFQQSGMSISKIIWKVKEQQQGDGQRDSWTVPVFDGCVCTGGNKNP